MLLALLLACRCDPLDPPQDVTFATPTLKQVGGRFYGQSDTPLAPQVAFEVEARCPRIESVHVRHANARIREVTVRGTGLAGVTRIGAALYDGTLANAQYIREGDTLVFPIACTRCEIYLGIPAKDRTAACIGPGYSLSFEDGRVVP
ncbi:MAG: hypothetical protein Q7U06_00995 [Pseudomonadota bacterium]|nr:hypothetical protein [Pseudomonadota bacterium]